MFGNYVFFLHNVAAMIVIRTLSFRFLRYFLERQTQSLIIMLYKDLSTCKYKLLTNRSAFLDSKTSITGPRLVGKLRLKHTNKTFLCLVSVIFFCSPDKYNVYKACFSMIHCRPSTRDTRTRNLQVQSLEFLPVDYHAFNNLMLLLKSSSPPDYLELWQQRLSRLVTKQFVH